MPLTIAVDFDGTCVKDCYPHVGPDIFGAALALKKCAADGHKLILWTCREHSAYGGVPDTLQLALDWFAKKDIPLYAVNGNPDPVFEGYPICRKCHADIMIDDHGIGVPRNEAGELDWFRIYTLIKNEQLRIESEQ